MFKSIVVGTDGSRPRAKRCARPPSWPAARRPRPSGLRLRAGAERRGARSAGAGSGAVDWALGPPREAVDATLAAGRRGVRAAGVAVDLYARRGDAADAILDVAEERGADLIIVGNRGTTGASRFLLGSVPNKISHHAPCAVLIIRTP
jgi:nucleotide-binding universal stress UspA family protein